MSASRIDAVANAVLYEGYMLYPYRPSAIKNRQRFNFGVVVPESKPKTAFSSEISCMTTECLVRGDSHTRLHAEVRFLQLVNRDVSPIVNDTSSQDVGLGCNGQRLTSWQEAVERRVESGWLQVSDLLGAEWRKAFAIDAGCEKESLLNAEGSPATEISRSRRALSGVVSLRCERLLPDLLKVTLKIVNTSEIDQADRSTLMTSLLSTHTVMRAEHGAFVSLTDPPSEVRSFVDVCKNVGTWPVLAGDSPDRSDVLLSSPIILSDYPEIAPESAGELFDGTEIDEILALRILTLTNEEKNEIRSGDERTRAILERTEALPPEQFTKLHGAMRALTPSSKEPA